MSTGSRELDRSRTTCPVLQVTVTREGKSRPLPSGLRTKPRVRLVA